MLPLARYYPKVDIDGIDVSIFRESASWLWDAVNTMFWDIALRKRGGTGYNSQMAETPFHTALILRHV
jgi:hypothetical protein